MEYDAYEFYKPFRNNLRKVCVEDSLYVVWAYIQNIHLNCKMPQDIEANHQFLHHQLRAEKGIYSWELELIAREVIINGQQGQRCPETLKEWSYLRRSFNKLRDLENGVGQMSIDQGNVLLELHRVAHRQFPWQNHKYKQLLVRHYKIFKHPGIARIVKEKTNISVYQLYLIGFMLFSVYHKHPAMLIPIQTPIAELTSDDIDNFMKHFSRDLSEIRTLLVAAQDISDKYAYAYSPLKAFPLIRMSYKDAWSCVCPLPPLLLLRITAGLYYEIVHENGFDISFGNSYQNYVGEVLEKSNTNRKLSIIPEGEYFIGHDRKDTIDWRACEPEAALFIECKTKRLVLQAKVELADANSLNTELVKMSDFIVQIYKTIADYANNHYPDFRFDSKRKIFPILATLEDWYFFGDKLHPELRRLVEDKFKEHDLPRALLDEMPYTICSVEELEELMQVIQQHGINKVMGEKVHDKEKNTWSIMPYLTTGYRAELDHIPYIFAEDYEKLFEQIVRTVSGDVSVNP